MRDETPSWLNSCVQVHLQRQQVCQEAEQVQVQSQRLLCFCRTETRRVRVMDVLLLTLAFRVCMGEMEGGGCIPFY